MRRFHTPFVHTDSWHAIFAGSPRASGFHLSSLHATCGTTAVAHESSRYLTDICCVHRVGSYGICTRRLRTPGKCGSIRNTKHTLDLSKTRQRERR
jgi:hypothetical protein